MWKVFVKGGNAIFVENLDMRFLMIESNRGV